MHLKGLPELENLSQKSPQYRGIMTAANLSSEEFPAKYMLTSRLPYNVSARLARGASEAW